MAILGLCHLEGKGMAKDKMKALSLIREAVEKKYSMAQGVLGLCYRRGLGVKKDAKRAVDGLPSLLNKDLCTHKPSWACATKWV